jgi:hypothetical protein
MLSLTRGYRPLDNAGPRPPTQISPDPSPPDPRFRNRPVAVVWAHARETPARDEQRYSQRPINDWCSEANASARLRNVQAAALASARERCSARSGRAAWPRGCYCTVIVVCMKGWMRQ